MTGPSRLFVYGTLLPGRLRWPLLAPYAVGHRPAAVPGILYDSGRGWPVAAFVATIDTAAFLATIDKAVFVATIETAAFQPDGVVPGTLVELAPGLLTECLALIDEVEDTATDELRRIEVTTTDGDAAWAYHYPHATEAFVPIERWDLVDPADER